MKIFRTDQVKEIDTYTIKNEPIESINLMERAAGKIFNWIIDRYSPEKIIKIFVGPGNNGGDGLAVARMLADKGFCINLYYVKFTDKVSDDWKINFDRLQKQGKVKLNTIAGENAFPDIKEDELVLDGIFGSGITRPLKGLPVEIVHHINQSNAEVIAIDIPSGLFGEDNSKNEKNNIIRANVTLTLQFPPLSFFFAENESFVGNWYVLPIGLHKKIINQMLADHYFITEEFVKGNLMVRKKFSHKGTFGHALLISGCYGRMGAAVLASKACLRTGIGLLTAHVPKLGCQIIQNTVPEAMISIDHSDILFSEVPDLDQFNAIGIGPAIGCSNNSQKAVRELLGKAGTPIIMDADALNILGSQKEWLNEVPENSIFTPHPKEFERLAGKTSDHFRLNMVQIEFAQKYKVYVVLKGAYTAIACPDGTCYFNTTGNPGMATAGSGDVLTGIILSLLGQQYSPKLSAIIGVYIHGLAGDIAAEQMGQEALIASDIIDNLGGAFNRIKNF
jgi:hydroxyethylthiazole kinase-like uncharacterized protein yjeF